MDQTCTAEAVWFYLEIGVEYSAHKSKYGEWKDVVTIRMDISLVLVVSRQ